MPDYFSDDQEYQSRIDNTNVYEHASVFNFSLP